MENKGKMPLWLKEIVKRGFEPKKNFKLSKGLFSYVESNTRELMVQPDQLIFALEGIPGSGKTTILKHFSLRNIECVQQMLPQEIKDGQPLEFFERSEELKTEQVITSKYRIALLDRYYVSTLAFYWAADQLLGTNNYDKVFQWYLTSISNKKIIKPFIVFYFKTKLSSSFLRKNRTPSSNSSDIWLSEEFLSLFDKYYLYFYKEIEPNTKLIVVDTDNDIKYVFEEVNKIIKKYEKI